jgi:hypothetical protein
LKGLLKVLTRPFKAFEGLLKTLKAFKIPLKGISKAF